VVVWQRKNIGINTDNRGEKNPGQKKEAAASAKNCQILYIPRNREGQGRG